MIKFVHLFQPVCLILFYIKYYPCKITSDSHTQSQCVRNVKPEEESKNNLTVKHNYSNIILFKFLL